jgi:putative transposase
MPNYRRIFQPGGTFFFTVVTERRRPLLLETVARRCLRTAIRQVQAQRPFEITAIVLLPNHLHCIWKLPARLAAFKFPSMGKGGVLP